MIIYSLSLENRNLGSGSKFTLLTFRWGFNLMSYNNDDDDNDVYDNYDYDNNSIWCIIFICVPCCCKSFRRWFFLLHSSVTGILECMYFLHLVINAENE